MQAFISSTPYLVPSVTQRSRFKTPKTTTLCPVLSRSARRWSDSVAPQLARYSQGGLGCVRLLIDANRLLYCSFDQFEFAFFSFVVCNWLGSHGLIPDLRFASSPLTYLASPTLGHLRLRTTKPNQGISLWSYYPTPCDPQLSSVPVVLFT